MFDEDFEPVSPANFFELNLSLPAISPQRWKEEIVKKKYLLPETGWLLGETEPLNLHLGWSPEGLYGFLLVQGAFDAPSYPALTEGDSFELFVDTRPTGAAGGLTRFCHHFYFLPQAVEGHQKGECTHFRTEEAHPLADPEELYLEGLGSQKEGKLKFHIPASCLIGWNPAEFDRLGLSCRLNRRAALSTHLSALSKEFSFEQEPALWATCQLN